MNSQVRRVVVKAAQSAPSVGRGASSSTSSLSLYQYASEGLRQLARQHREPHAPADWKKLIKNAAWGLPIYAPVTAAALFWPYPVKKLAEVRYH
ncbi:hypothetical protein VPNG_06217 [Cytospora leucostoma]|uniref:Uncharacterized protein n=1 Tax=Cytospora leucostoma TaxID=1230097 RepID=A0A423WYG5_9PEZI|nr:hypothetical protein VPNG_06217 [Cytospora leucostoma]